VAVVAYAGSAGLVLPPTSANDADTITRALQRLTAGGSTAMGAGIQLAYAQADAAYEPGAVNRVIIASDGDANVGATSHGSLSETIGAYAKRGITLTTLGFGTGNYRDTIMEQIANDGDGNYFYIDSEREAQRVLVERMTSTLEVVARDVKLQVEFFPWAVERYRLLGYENRAIADRDFDNDAVDAGEVGAGHQVTALYEVVWAGPPGALGEVHLRHKAPGPDAPSVERSFEIPWDDAAFELAGASPQLRMAAAAALFAGVLKGSPHLDGAGLDTAEALAVSAQRAEYPEDAELVELIRTARRLTEPRTAQR
jgi:Ca-activated chloride channel family protein